MIPTNNGVRDCLFHVHVLRSSLLSRKSGRWLQEVAGWLVADVLFMGGRPVASARYIFSAVGGFPYCGR